MFLCASCRNLLFSWMFLAVLSRMSTCVLGVERMKNVSDVAFSKKLFSKVVANNIYQKILKKRKRRKEKRRSKEKKRKTK